MVPHHVTTDEEILEAARALYELKGWFTSRDIYAELVQERCPKNEDRPLSLRRISLTLRRAGAQTILPLSNGYSRFVLPEEK